MKSRSFKTALILGTFVFTFAGATQAATYVYMYGSSAQYNFWTNYFPTLLQSLGCATGTQKYTNTDGKSQVTVGTNCPALLSSDDGTSDGCIYLSYSSKASWDAIDAILGVYDPNNSGSAPNQDSTGKTCAGNQRPVATLVPDEYGYKHISYICQSITIGTSDVEGPAFTQMSNGTQFGPLDPNDYAISRVFNNGTGINDSTLQRIEYKVGTTVIRNPQIPLAYPFAFYVNPGVKTYRCSPSASTNPNEFCVDDANCGGTAGSHTLCSAQTIDNLTRLQIVALLSGGIGDWSDFGVYYPAKPVTLCMLHAGSGASATLDYGIMEGNGWGNALVQTEQRVCGSAGCTGGLPYVYFNDGISDLQNCMKWADGQTFYRADTLDPGQQGGAIGYMDADNANNAHYIQIQYNGVWASRITMHDGIYDNFWAVSRLYVPYDLKLGQVLVYNSILTALKIPSNITDTTVGGTRGEYYGSFAELNFSRISSRSYPSVYSPADSPANPN